jgi:prepilin-type N-terminal cleavage/methylation domain-containing protein
MKTDNRNGGGFTLIELLVVISIIGLLSTIALTAMSGARNKAKAVSFQTTMKSVQAALLMCCESTVSSLKTSSAGADPVAGGSTCFNPSSSYAPIAALPSYPDDKSLGTIKVTSDCNQGTFTVEIMPGTNNIGGWAKAICDNDKCDFY